MLSSVSQDWSFEPPLATAEFAVGMMNSRGHPGSDSSWTNKCKSRAMPQSGVDDFLRGPEGESRRVSPVDHRCEGSETGRKKSEVEAELDYTENTRPRRKPYPRFRCGVSSRKESSSTFLSNVSHSKFSLWSGGIAYVLGKLLN